MEWATPHTACEAAQRKSEANHDPAGVEIIASLSDAVPWAPRPFRESGEENAMLDSFVFVLIIFHKDFQNPARFGKISKNILQGIKTPPHNSWLALAAQFGHLLLAVFSIMGQVIFEICNCSCLKLHPLPRQLICAVLP